MAQVKTLAVILDSLVCHQASADVTSEPGSEDEWSMVFTVDGQSQSWRNEHIRTNQTYSLGLTFLVGLDPDNPKKKSVRLGASGVEEDDTSANDVMPKAEEHLNPANDWQIGGSFSFSAADTEYSYEVLYRVEAAEFVEDGSSSQPLTVPRQYVGACRSGTGTWGLWSAPWASFEAKWQEWSKQGLRLSRLKTFFRETEEPTIVLTGERFWVGSFEAGTDGHALYILPWKEFCKKWEELSAEGLRLVDISTHVDNGKRLFVGVYRGGNDGFALFSAPWDAFEAKWKELTAAGLRLVALDTFVDNGTRQYVGVYRAGTDGHALWVGVEWSAFDAKRKELAKQGLHLVDVLAYPKGGTQVYGGVFRAGTGSQAILGPDSWEGFTADHKAAVDAGQRLVTIDTYQLGSED
jgi:hypothetical protein